jgi:ubiquinone/menaquinone biosynthesis C-methylase UbiE
MGDSLRSEISTPAGKSRYVRRLFATIADRYDLITVVLSYGRDRGWKRHLVRMASPGPGERVLDVACGTGDIAFELARRGAAGVVGLDITHRMVQLARARQAEVGNGPTRRRAQGAWQTKRRNADAGPRVVFTVGDICALPFPDRSFDIVTTGYGMRNVPEITTALAELRRVLKPGGRLLSLDFNRPDNGMVRAVYLAYLTVVGSALGYLLHRDPDTYRYIPESIRRYPGAAGISSLMQDQGFVDAGYQPVLGGLMAINWGRTAPATRQCHGSKPDATPGGEQQSCS